MSNVETNIANLGPSLEIEVDGHRDRSRSVSELRQLMDLQDEIAETEVPKLKKAGFKVQARSNGAGLI